MKHLFPLSLLLFTLLLFTTPSMSRVDTITTQPAAAAPVASPSPVPMQAQIEETLQSAPVMFIENIGQFDDDARFHVRGGDYDLWLANDALWINVLEAAPEEEMREPFAPEAHLYKNNELNERRQGINLKLSFVNANPQPEIEPFNLLETKMNYFLGNDEDKWRSNVPVWGGVRYKNIYPGIDLELTSKNGRSVQRLVTHSHAKIDDVQLRVEGVEELELLASADLIGKTAIGDVTLPLFTLVTPDGTPLDSTRAPTLNNNRIQAPFAPARQEARARVPDSTLAYSTFIGGGGADTGFSLALDSAGNAFVTGWTESSDFPTQAGSYDTTYNSNTDVFVLKLSSGGNALVYSTFIGGSSFDHGSSLALDSAGNAVVMGHTCSSDFPTTTDSYNTTDNGCVDLFLFKLSSAGNALLYSTFIGGSSDDWSNSLALDSAGNAVVTGYTSSNDFPTTADSYDTIHNGGFDVFVLKLSSAGDGLLYSTFIGGTSNDIGVSLGLDKAGNAVVTGWTESLDFPTTEDSYDTTYNGGFLDLFVLKLSSTGDALSYSTFIGGSCDEWGNSLALDSAGNTVVTGGTCSDGFPTTADSYDSTYNDNTDVFVLKLNATGNTLSYSTFIGGTSSDGHSGGSVVLDNVGNAVVIGETQSSDFPTTQGSYDTTYNDNADMFVLKLNATGNTLSYSTFIGGTSSDGHSGGSVVLDNVGNAVVIGNTESLDFPTTQGSYDSEHNGNPDVFVLRLDGLEPPPTPIVTHAFIYYECK